MSSKFKVPKVWAFDRYVDGQKKAEGCVIERAKTLEEALEKAKKLFRRDAPRSEFRLRAGVEIETMNDSMKNAYAKITEQEQTIQELREQLEQVQITYALLSDESETLRERIAELERKKLDFYDQLIVALGERDRALERNTELEAQQAMGTQECPICGDKEPHRHDDIRQLAYKWVCWISGSGMAHATDVLTHAIEQLLRERRDRALSELAEIRRILLPESRFREVSLVEHVRDLDGLVKQHVSELAEARKERK